MPKLGFFPVVSSAMTLYFPLSSFHRKPIVISEVLYRIPPSGFIFSTMNIIR